MADFVQFDKDIPYLQVTCQDDEDDSAIDLTNYTEQLRYRINDGPVKVRTMTHVVAASGTTKYVFTEINDIRELTKPGTLYYDVVLVNATGGETTCKTQGTKTIRART